MFSCDLLPRVPLHQEGKMKEGSKEQGNKESEFTFAVNGHCE